MEDEPSPASRDSQPDSANPPTFEPITHVPGSETPPASPTQEPFAAPPPSGPSKKDGRQWRIAFAIVIALLFVGMFGEQLDDAMTAFNWGIEEPRPAIPGMATPCNGVRTPTGYETTYGDREEHVDELRVPVQMIYTMGWISTETTALLLTIDPEGGGEANVYLVPRATLERADGSGGFAYCDGFVVEPLEYRAWIRAIVPAGEWGFAVTCGDEDCDVRYRVERVLIVD